MSELVYALNNGFWVPFLLGLVIGANVGAVLMGFLWGSK